MKKSRQMSMVLTLLLFVQLIFPALHAWGATDNGTILPPSNLATQLLTPDDVKLTWSPVYGATGYTVYSITYGQLINVGTTTTASFTINDLTEGSYSYVVSTLSSGGESGPCAPVNINITYPDMIAPATLTYTIQNGNNIVLNWGTAPNVQTYNLYVNQEGGRKLVYSGTARTFTVNNAAEGIYTYTVTASHPLYGESPNSTAVEAAIGYLTMTAPSGLTYTVATDDVTLKWNTAAYATGYNVYQIIDNQKVLKSSKITGKTVSYMNLPAGNYTYMVHSFSDRFGESVEGSTISLTVGTMVPPSNLTFKLQNVNDVVLTWSAATNATSYKVYQVIDGEKVLKNTVTGTTVTFTNMLTGDYVYEVHSLSNLFGESTDGSTVSLTVGSVTMTPPATLASKLQNLTDIVLTWTVAPNATSYKIYQVIGDEKVLKSTVTGTTVTYVNLPAGDYLYEVHSVSTRFGESAEGTQVALTVGEVVMAAPGNFAYKFQNVNDVVLTWTVAPNATAYKVYQIVDGSKVLKSTVAGTTVTYTNLASGNYTYEIHSNSTRYGESAESAQATFSIVLPTMLPPSNLVQSVTSATAFSLNWDAAANGNSYKVYQIVNGQKVLKSTVATTKVSYSNMEPGDYTYEVHTVSTRFGESPEGTILTFTLNDQTMQAPASLTYSLANVNDLTLKWTSVPNATSYKVYQVIDGQKVLKSTLTGLTVTYANIPGGDYQYVVDSYSTILGESPEGAEVSFNLILPTMVGPGNLAAKAQNGNDVVLTWVAAPYANSYKVYEIINGAEVLKSTMTTLAVTYTNVTAGDHTYVVHSVSTKFGESLEGSKVSLSIVFPVMQAPGSLTQTIANGNDITLKWGTSTYATSYKIYQVVDGEKVLKSTLTGTTVTYTNMPAGDYTYEVHSYSSRFGESPEGEELLFKLVHPIMEAPGNVTKSVTNGNDITLKWGTVTYATAYRVYQIVDGQRELKKTQTGTTVTFTNMPEGDYNYEVYSYSDRFGESPKAGISTFTLTWPVLQPSQLKGTVTNANNLTLTWTTATWANEYRVYEVTGDTRQLMYKGAALTTQLFNLTEKTHYYELVIYNTRFGESAPSNRLNFDIIFPDMQSPVASSRLLSQTSAVITWNFVTYANGYNVYEIVNGQPILLVKNLNNLSYTVNNLSYANHLYYVSSYSNSFGESDPSNTVEAKLIVDTEAPVTTATAPTDWTNQSAAVTLSATDNETGVANTFYSLNDQAFVPGTAVTVSQEGSNKVSFYSVDKVGNKEATKIIYVKIDKTAPVTKASNIQGWSKEAIVTLAATDDQSGVAKTLYSVNGGDYAEGTSVTVSQEGVSQVSFYSVDQAGNAEKAKTVEVKIDRTAPVTTATATEGWTKSDAIVTLAAADSQSSVAKTLYSVNGGDYAEGTSVTVSQEGVSQVSFYSVDQAGNAEKAQTVEVKIDRTAPMTTATATEGWTKSDAIVTLAAADGQSGVAKTLYSVNGEGYAEGTSVTVSQEGVSQVSFYSVDQAGNAEKAQTVEVKIDRTAPMTTATATEGWTKSDAIVTLAAADGQSGVAKTLYSVNGEGYAEGTSVTVSQEGVSQVSFYSVDQAGNEEKAQTVEVKIDRTAPVTTATATEGWTKSDATVTLAAADGQSGVAKTLYSVNGGGYTEGTSVTVSQEGVSQVSFYSVDQAGNEEKAQTVEVKIDRTAPVTTATATEGWTKSDATVTLAAADGQSGVAKTLYSVNGGGYTEGTSVTVSQEGVSQVSFYSVDQAGNEEKAQTVEVKIDRTAPEITMNLNNEYKLNTMLTVSYSTRDILSGVVSDSVTIKEPGESVGKPIANESAIKLDKPGTYTITVNASNAAGLSTTIQKQFVVYIAGSIEVTPTVIKGNNGVFTVRVNLPEGFKSEGFDLNTVTLNGVKALTSNNGYYNQAKNGQFKFERSDFTWTGPNENLEYRGFLNGFLVIGQTIVKVQK
ncbi:fibronectin type 3 domain-containing protein/phosphotransferase system HPr-like phosphotransfer protein [Paenibacillus sp. V4I3]|uniref:OmpL47-type beta-barrel domain-containing protein n=1 Tax=Paenibacillus sp. V4I3 TaxID=3042305 RepID=UPI0027807091|nr:hypothetical protein [Paenibacillus sp. V4I3]MDQ0872323.1 fibronectin type 3 domain-containing protein/phosphotransferase system HPr-like phosphotransfer protein [Paenibacillus sp. V4I3]